MEQAARFRQETSRPCCCFSPRCRSSSCWFSALLARMWPISCLRKRPAAGAKWRFALRSGQPAASLRQMLLESLLLALGGGVFGACLPCGPRRHFPRFVFPHLFRLTWHHVDWRVQLYTFALSVGAGLLLGFMPAWIASRPSWPVR